MLNNVVSKIKASRYLPTIKFTLFYTLFFLFIVYTAKYTLPFLIGFIFAAIVQPLYKFMRKKLSFKKGFAAAVITTFLFVLIIALICWIIITIITEITELINSISENSVPISTYFSNIIKSVEDILGDGFFKLTADKIFEYFSAGVEAMSTIYNFIMMLFTSIPAIFTMIIVAVFSTYYFTNDFDKIKSIIGSMLGKKRHKKMSRVYHEGAKMIKGFFKSCTVLYTLTFIETLFVFIVFKIKYPIFFAVLTAVADVIPILGPGTIYIPLSIIYLLAGDFFKALVVIISFALISIIRQFIEPKIISNSIQIHPLLVLTAIYFSLVSRSLWVLIYLILYFVLYQVLLKTELIHPLFEDKNTENHQLQ